MLQKKPVFVLGDLLCTYDVLEATQLCLLLHTFGRQRAPVRDDAGDNEQHVDEQLCGIFQGLYTAYEHPLPEGYLEASGGEVVSPTGVATPCHSEKVYDKRV